MYSVLKKWFAVAFGIWWSLVFVLIVFQMYVMSQQFLFLFLALPIGGLMYFLFHRGFVRKAFLRYKILFGTLVFLSVLPLVLQVIGLKSPDITNVLSACIGVAFWYSLYW